MFMPESTFIIPPTPSIVGRVATKLAPPLILRGLSRFPIWANEEDIAKKVTSLPVMANDAVEAFDTLASMFVCKAELEAFN